jgi:hypothetical protein
VRSISVDPGISHIYDESLTPLLGQVQCCLVVVCASGPHPQLFTTTCIGKPIAGLHKAAIGDLRSGDNGLTSKALDESLDHFAAKLSPPRLKTQTVTVTLITHFLDGAFRAKALLTGYSCQSTHK